MLSNVARSFQWLLVAIGLCGLVAQLVRRPA